MEGVMRELSKIGISEDTVKRVKRVIVICIVAGALFIIGYFLIYANYKTELHAESCIYTTAKLVEAKRNPYQWVPQHGGRIQMRYDHIYTYEFTDTNEISYVFTINTKNIEYKGVEEIGVRYEVETPRLFEFDINELYGKEKKNWVLYWKTDF